MMRSAFFSLLCGVAICSTGAAFAADNELTSEEQQAGWILLFNGTDHTGWKTNESTDIATPVEDGALVPYESGGYLIVYEKPFGDFTLACDVKMSEPECNSGIFFRVGDLKDPVYTGFEVQVMTGSGVGYHELGAIYDLVPTTKNNGKANEWNHVEITCKGPNVSVAVNGEEVSKMNVDEFDQEGLRPDGTKHKFGVAIKNLPRSGYLGFQDHGQKCWYKNVKLLEHKEAAAEQQQQ